MFKISENLIKISVIGGSQCSMNVFNQAYEVGKEIAKKGAVLVCGGLGGVMEAACRGAKDSEGLTIGILPGEDEHSANKYVDIKIPTGIGYARNSIVVKSGHAIIAINGGFGTLSEIAYSLTYNIPVIGLGTWKLKPYCESEEHKPEIINASSPEEAVEIAISEASRILGLGKY